MGIGMAATERHIYDPQNGLPANIGLLQRSRSLISTCRRRCSRRGSTSPTRRSRSARKGVGEPVQGCAAAALLCAISDALGGHYFNRTPVMPDMIVNAAAKREQSHKPLQVNTASAPRLSFSAC